MIAQPPLWLILVAFVCLIGPLVFFHELGHYLVARLFKVPAEIFSIGFGHEIFGWTDRQKTRWKVGWLPVGGYVKFVGDMGPASDPAEVEDIPPELRDRAFQFRPVWQRFLIVLAGPIANFMLAIVIFTAFFAVAGVPQTDNIITKIQVGSVADKAGIRPGDRIIAISGRETPTFEDIYNFIAMRPAEPATLLIERQNQRVRIPLTIGETNERDRFGHSYRIGRLGIYGTVGRYVKLSPAKLVPAAADYTVKITRSMIDGLWQIISGRRSLSELGGPVKIAQVAGEGASLGALPFVQLLALLSINLGFINLLPVPMLDGGHLFFYAVEGVRRRPLSAQALEWAFRGGFAVILALMVFLTINDLGSLGLWDRLQRLIG